MTVYCYDTEFLEDGSTIELISIGIVCEDGREYYAVNGDMDVRRIVNDPWLAENVWPHLPITHPGLVLDRSSTLVKRKDEIADQVGDFLLADGEPELWAYYGAYDHVALAQLWGKMIHLPDGLPMWTHELMQLAEQAPGVEKPPQEYEHDALADARWNLKYLGRLREVVR